MTEAWLLINEQAIREAAGNPNGRIPLELPDLRALESLPDPKKALFRVLSMAGELSGRRLRRFRHFRFRQRQRVAELIGDYSPLETLPAFRALREDLEQILIAHDWR